MMDLQAQIDAISARIDETLKELEAVVLSIVESKEKIIRLELSILEDRIQHLENESKNKEEINYMTVGLFS